MASGLGLAKTDNFMLGSASVMLGAQADVWNLNPTDHGIGLVKNFSIQSDPGYVELTQGVKGDIVHSVLTSNPVTASMEVYEYTGKNLTYGLGLDGSSVAENTVDTTVATTAITGDDIVVQFEVADTTGFAVDQYIIIRGTDKDNVAIRKVAAVDGVGNTLDVNEPFATGQNFAVGSTVEVYNEIQVGSKEDQPFFSAKVVGELANKEPVVILIPKIRIVRGFNMAFGTDDYGNLPFEFTMYDLVSTDPNFAIFEGQKAKIFKK